MRAIEILVLLFIGFALRAGASEMPEKMEPESATLEVIRELHFDVPIFKVYPQKVIFRSGEEWLEKSHKDWLIHLKAYHAMAGDRGYVVVKFSSELKAIDINDMLLGVKKLGISKVFHFSPLPVPEVERLGK